MEKENTKAPSNQKLKMKKGLITNNHEDRLSGGGGGGGATNNDGSFDGIVKKKKGGHSGGGGGGGGGSSSGVRCCQAEKCTTNLSEAKQYHRRHKVCELHAKAQAVIVAGTHQRFCQQCSRFHELIEFDDTKRSCRRRLAGHNERRRKSSIEFKGTKKEQVDDTPRFQDNWEGECHL